MKVCVVLFFCLAGICFCATTMRDVIRKEVEEIYKTDPALTVDHCKAKCDALFDLVAGNDEGYSDHICRQECLCNKANNCTTHHGHGHHSTNQTTTAPTTAVPTVILQ